MIIKTKLNIGDDCYVVHKNKIVKSKVCCIKVNIDIPETSEIKYYVENTDWFSEEFVFKTKEDILKYLEEEIEEV